MLDQWARALRGLLVVLLLLPSVVGQIQEKPQFDKYHVVPGILTPGQFATVLGWHLTPEPWCGAPHSQEPPYPLTLCAVQVLVGGHPAGVMYAGPIGNRVLNADQINFEVPANVRAEGEVPIQVCVGKTCSDPLNVPFTNKDILLRVEQKAYVHMPLWVDFTIPFNKSFGYPASSCPWDFGGFQIEVRKGGHVLPPRPIPKCPAADPVGRWSAMRLQAGASHRLPVHLNHLFHTPGEYELRMSGPLLTPDLSKVARTGYSDWIRVTVEPFSDAERQAWLSAVTSAVPAGNPRRNESEVIVSLLAEPDEKALKAMLNFLPSPPPTDPAAVPRVMRGNFTINWTRSCLARSALAAFPEALLRKLIPPGRLAYLREAPTYCYWR